MPLTIRCPKCGKELVAPDELLGKVAACPQCNLTFPIAGSARTPSPPMLIPVGPPAAPEPAPAARSSTHPGGSSTVITSAVPTNLPPPATSQSTVNFKPLGELRASASLSESAIASLRAEPRPAKSANTQSVSANASSSTSTSGTAPRAAQPARFITANPTERRIDLGADGRLPELILQEGTKSEQPSSAERTSNPLVLVAVLTVSFGLSAAMLFVDTGARRSESQLKAMARDELALHYTQTMRRPEPYQELLRQALQLHNQGKYADELACYRRVLDLLHEEHRENLKGLTGVRHGTAPPSDEHLESLLSQLLSND